MTAYPKISALPVLAAVAALLAFAEPATAKIPEGLVNCAREDRSKCEAWWSRRSPAQKKWFLGFDVEDRNNAAVCFQLLGFPEPNKMLERCARNKIADRRSMAECMAAGHELLTEELADCQDKWKRRTGNKR